jgi:hypothetical protein
VSCDVVVVVVVVVADVVVVVKKNEEEKDNCRVCKFLKHFFLQLVLLLLLCKNQLLLQTLL